MRFTLLAIGKARAGPESDLYRHYRERLRWTFELVELDLKKPLATARARQEAEAELLIGALPKGAIMIALDERGKNLSSRDFALQIQQLQDNGARDIALIIGGADGLAPALRQQARLLISYGKATWPHMLVRGMLTEQLYRAQTILDGHPYHRD